MASHCHPYHHHCHPTAAAAAASAAACCCCCCCCSSSTQSHHPPTPEPLIIQCQSVHPSPTQPHVSSPCSPFNLQTHQRYQQTRYYYPPQTPNHKQNFQRHRYHQDEEEEEANPMVSSLLRRISALESSFRHHSCASFSLRNAAARTIQTHFRAFLVRRSRTLRQLKDLAFIKAALNTLKSTHSNNTRSDSRALSHKATGLLHKLDSIQGGDPMIRDGKRSINRELARFMEYLDELSMKRYQLSSRAVKSVRRGGTGTKSRVLEEDEIELLEKLRKRVEKIEGLSRVSEEDVVELANPRTHINGKSGVSQIRNGILVKRHSGVQAKAKKNVSSAEYGNVNMVYRRSNGPVSVSECNSFDGSDSVDAEELGREVEEIGNGDDEEEAHTDDTESSQISDDDRGPGRKMVAESDNEMSMHDPIEKEDGSFVFSAPLPVKMEPRPDLMNKKTVKRTN